MLSSIVFLASASNLPSSGSSLEALVAHLLIGPCRHINIVHSQVSSLLLSVSKELLDLVTPGTPMWPAQLWFELLPPACPPARPDWRPSWPTY